MNSHQHLFQGLHVLGELYGIASEHLDDMDFLEQALTEGIEKSGATLCSMLKKKFTPSGVTLLALLSESHASIHTYPGENALFFDGFTCGTECQPQKIAESLVAALKPQKSSLQLVQRGIFLEQPLFTAQPMIRPNITP